MTFVCKECGTWMCQGWMSKKNGKDTGICTVCAKADKKLERKSHFIVKCRACGSTDVHVSYTVDDDGVHFNCKKCKSHWHGHDLG